MRSIIGGILLLLAFSIASAQDSGGMDKTSTANDNSNQAAKPVTYKGYLIDAMCAKGMVDKADPMAKAAEHTKTCSLQESCEESGYGVMSEGVYHKFDKNGDEKALSFLKKIKSAKSPMIEVTGIQGSSDFTVNSIKAVKTKTSMRKHSRKMS